MPTHYEQFIYSIVAYNGRDYSGTFVRQPVGSLFLIAGRDNFISARTTMVYYWPLTKSYRLDTNTIDHQFGGKLRITGNGIDRTLGMEKYTYYNVRGEYELNWKVAKGPAAEQAYAAYEKVVSDYENAVYAYQQAQSTYQQKLQNLAQEITALRNKGGNTARLVEQLRSLKQPSPPQTPSTYTSPPVAPQNAFVVNLPAGVYHIELINPNGTIMQGSEKRLVVFSSSGAETVGYDVIPGDKWTRPETSTSPGSVLYVNGTTDLYLRPYFEKQYNELDHQRLVNNDARGNPNMESWVKLQQVPNARVTLSADGRSSTEKQEPFAVEQLQGGSLGYKIVPWGQAQHQGGQKPDIIAFHVPISLSNRVIRVSTLDEHGKLLRGSAREIRVVAGNGPQFILVILILLPLLAGGIVMAMRSRRYSA